MNQESPPEELSSRTRPDAASALYTARWAVLGALLLLTVGQYRFPELLGYQAGGPWIPLGLLSLGAGLNALASVKQRAWSPRVAALHLTGDVLGLTLFLALSGAAANPFTMLYFVPIGLATLLPKGFTWLVALGALLGFAVLLFITTQSGPLNGHFLHHLVGMWLGLAVSGGAITLFVHRLAAALTRQKAELEVAREAALEAHHLAALGGLAAGAAHELGTPLGTIQLLADELEQMPESERREALEAMRHEILRCKTIIHSLSPEELSAQLLEQAKPWPLESLQVEFEQSGALRRPGQAHEPRVTVRVTTSAGQLTTQPEVVIRRSLGELVNNAIEATAAQAEPARIEVEIEVDGEHASVSVSDNGPGLDEAAESAAFDAFYSTKARGRGLGLYLARAHLRQLGGELSLSAARAGGARFNMRFPLQAPRLRQVPGTPA